ncbi:MAG: SWIM zinc finger family protein [Lyngbya sp.]|nr:SWIM zinc finger family protein [Lyngbya sp.]
MTNYDIQTDREWWSQQWLDLLDKYRFKKRLERARNYARQGNVLSINFEDQKVKAKVQGTQPEPYEVSLWLDQFSDEEWGFVIETLSQRAIFSAKLLAGEMPQNIEEVFAANGLRLFPFSLDDVHAHCSCPDKANPCKHIAAIYYLLGDRFSEDPFVLFLLRGRTQEKIIANLRQLRSQTEEETETKPQALPETETVNSYPPKVEEFWQYNEQLDPSLVVITPPASSDNVLNVLGSIPLETAANQTPGRSISASETVMQYLDTIYKNISQRAVLMALSRDEETQ